MLNKNIHISEESRNVGEMMGKDLLSSRWHHLPIQQHLAALADKLLTSAKQFRTAAKIFTICLDESDRNLDRDKARYCIARHYSYENWAAVEALASQTPDSEFEFAVDLLLKGEITQLEKLLTVNPQLVNQRSKYPHGATLIHYAGANGVEMYRQVVPLNIAAIVKMLLDKGAHPFLLAHLYGGCNAMTLVSTSKHPADAAVLSALYQIYKPYMCNPTFVDDLSTPELADLADEFLDLACLQYKGDDAPLRRYAAVKLLASYPSIRAASIYTACALGDLSQTEEWLKRDPSLIDKKGGPNHWEPLMYAAYSRLPDCNTFATAKYLLQKGANPNANTTIYWGAEGATFSVLAGVFGEGERGPKNCPRHPDYESLARLLLESGAKPNDFQSAYNHMFTDDNDCLELLFEYGLANADVDHEIRHYQLMWAIQQGNLARVKLLLAHNVDLSRKGTLLGNGRTPLLHAIFSGQKTIAKLLQTDSNTFIKMDHSDKLAIACINNDYDQAQQLIKNNSSLVAQTQAKHPRLLHQAVLIHNVEAVEHILNLGFDVNYRNNNTALHEAAGAGDLDMLKLLISKGAKLSVRDHCTTASAIAWAERGGHEQVIEFLKTQPMDIFDAIRFNQIDQVKGILENHPDQATMTYSQLDFDLTTAKCNILQATPLEMAILHNRPAVIELLLRESSINNDNMTRIKELLESSNKNSDLRPLFDKYLQNR